MSPQSPSPETRAGRRTWPIALIMLLVVAAIIFALWTFILPPSEEEILDQVQEAVFLESDRSLTQEKFLVDVVVQETVPLDTFLDQELSYTIDGQEHSLSLGEADVLYTGTILVEGEIDVASMTTADVQVSDGVAVVSLPPMQLTPKVDDALSDVSVDESLSPLIDFGAKYAFAALAPTLATAVEAGEIVAMEAELIEQGVIEDFIVDFDRAVLNQLGQEAETKSVMTVCEKGFVELSERRIELALEKLLNERLRNAVNAITIDVQITPASACSGTG